MAPDDPVFETERLVARPWKLDDGPAAFELYGDPRVTRYIGGVTWSDLDEAAAGVAGFVERSAQWGPGLGGFPLHRRDDGLLIGAVLVKHLPGVDRAVPTADLEVGWHLARRHQGQGYATEAGLAVIEYAFETLDVAELIAVVEPPNKPSQAVARRCGMRHVGRTRAYYGGIDLEKFVLTRTEWLESRPPRDGASRQ